MLTTRQALFPLLAKLTKKTQMPALVRVTVKPFGAATHGRTRGGLYVPMLDKLLAAVPFLRGAQGACSHHRPHLTAEHTGLNKSLEMPEHAGEESDLEMSPALWLSEPRQNRGLQLRSAPGLARLGRNPGHWQAGLCLLAEVSCGCLGPERLRGVLGDAGRTNFKSRPSLSRRYLKRKP